VLSLPWTNLNSTPEREAERMERKVWGSPNTAASAAASHQLGQAGEDFESFEFFHAPGAQCP
jgi:hypothetical protein